MTTNRRHRLLPLLVAFAALPATMGPGRCGFALDYTETYLITDEIDRVVLAIDDGSVISTSYERDALLLKRHVFAFEPSLETAEHEVDGRDLKLEARCKYDGNCSFDHMFETPPAVDFDITLDEGWIDLGYTRGDIVVDGRSVWFRGVQLGSRTVEVALEEGDVDVELISPPALVDVAVTTGDVTLTVPAGAYRCDFTAGGAVRNDGVTCDETAAESLRITVGAGTITVTGEP